MQPKPRLVRLSISPNLRCLIYKERGPLLFSSEWLFFVCVCVIIERGEFREEDISPLCGVALHYSQS